MEQKCPNCNGGGVIQEYDELDRYHVLECGRCNGSGVIDTNKLKPCPFCSGEADIHECADFDSDMLKVVYGGMCGVHCTQCSISTLPYDSEQEAIEAWNRRTE